MGTWQLIELILNLVELGFRADELRAKLQQEKAAGKTDREIGEMLQKMADDKLAGAQAQIDK